MPILPNPKNLSRKEPVNRFDPYRPGGPQEARLRRTERLIKQCTEGHCARPDYEHYYGEGGQDALLTNYRLQHKKNPTPAEKKQIRAFEKLDKVFRKDMMASNIKKDLSTGSFIFDDDDMCDDCLVAHYNLRITNDALDHLGMIDLLYKDEVLVALRKARMGE